MALMSLPVAFHKKSINL